MSLSERERRILAEIERELAGSAPLAGPLRWRVWLPLRARLAGSGPARWLRPRGRAGWIAVMVAGLLAGIALLTAGVVLDVPGAVIGGAALTQLGPVAGWLASAFRRRPGN